MTTPIKQVEDALLTISKELQQARNNAKAMLVLDPEVFDQVWALAAGRSANGVCPCCGTPRTRP